MNAISSLLIVDDHPMVIAGLQQLLSSLDFVQVKATACSAAMAMAKLKEQAIDIVLLDINLPDVNGIDLCKKMKGSFPEVKIVGLSTFSERSYILRMLDNGASGYLIKSASAQEIENALRTVLDGKLYLSLAMEHMLQPAATLQAGSLPALTRREKEVLQLIANGKTNTQIAAELFISPLTVDSHRKNLLTKLDVHNTAALIRLAVEQRLLD
ncbi:response regulator transcription factor [Arachidicoccus ginsenosidivorans]|uniref:Response regulator transcription factor n=2 Tax=Arachidicoccus ginsenosidivorans TaxID=496057 RepID=A0A5B8VSM9_9BACT|nr:response regulator transcription factor [Arachidicoccus ginsenosidivorans]